MNYLILIERLVATAARIWDRVSPRQRGASTETGETSQRDIAIQVAASETARQEGIRAAELAKQRKKDRP